MATDAFASQTFNRPREVTMTAPQGAYSERVKAWARRLTQG